MLLRMRLVMTLVNKKLTCFRYRLNASLFSLVWANIPFIRHCGSLQWFSSFLHFSPCIFLSCALIGGDAFVRRTVVFGGMSVVFGGMTTSCGGSYAVDAVEVDATGCGCACVCVGVCSVFAVVDVPLVRHG